MQLQNLGGILRIQIKPYSDSAQQLQKTLSKNGMFQPQQNSSILTVLCFAFLTGQVQFPI